MIDRLLDVQTIKRVFDRVSLVMDLEGDVSLLRAAYRLAAPQGPLELDGDVFEPASPLEVPALAGKRVGVVATGGGGAMVCAVGVMRALEEAGVHVAGISACSGGAMALAPIAAGLSAEDTARFLLGLHQRDYVHPDWKQLLKLPFALGRGFTGLLDSTAIERVYAARLGQEALHALPIPFYANVWDMDRNRLLYLGPKTRPDMRLPEVVRAAVTLPLFMRPFELDGAQCGDGGVVNIFPVDPLVDLHPEIDFYVGVNAFYPQNFEGEDRTGWHEQTFSVLRVSPQAQQCQQLESARMQLRRIQDRCVMVHPLPYALTKGVRLYEQFVDRRPWVDFMRRGHAAGRAALAGLA